MLAAREYLPIGSVVLLKNAMKKTMVIGIMPIVTKDDGKQKSYDYTGVLYPEGLLSIKASFVFNQEQITDVVFRGYENPEREDFIRRLEANMEKRESEPEQEAPEEA